MNDASLPGYTTLNFDARLPITWRGAQDTYLQFNIYNLTNTRYPTRSTTVSNAQPAVAPNPVAAQPHPSRPRVVRSAPGPTPLPSPSIAPIEEPSPTPTPSPSPTPRPSIR